MGLPSSKFALEGTVSYEVDLWGRLRRQRDAAGERAAASLFDQEAARLSVAAAVSRTWLGHRITSTQLAAARSTLASRREALDLQQLRAEAGVVDELQLQQARAEKAAALAIVKTLELTFAQERHALAVLLGKDPAELSGATLPQPKNLPQVPQVPALLPSQLLARRPDVRAGEARLMAAAGDVAAARTALLPSLSLTGNLGSESRTLGSLFDPGTTIWTLAADLVQAVFSGGRYRAGIARSEAQQEQLLVAYQQLVRGAFREVLDALVAQRQLREAIAARQEELAARQKALDLATLRYDAGYVTYLEVLDSQRNLFATEQEKLNLERSALENAVGLMLALGGGWQEQVAGT
jgi:multidrug efflux system outer membrane protein